MNARMDQYRIFNITAESRSVSQAAERLFMTQSAVSQSIKQLELSLDTKLFIRTPRGIELTREGEVLHQYTASAVELLETAERRMNSFKDLSEGELRIGASDTISSYYLLPHLENFHKMYPEIKLQVMNGVTSETINLLKNGKIDLAFVNLPVVDESLRISECMQIHDIFVAGNGYEQYKDKVFTRSEIAQLPLILLETKSNSRNYVDSTFFAGGQKLKAAIELGAHELLLQFAKIDLGVSCVIKEFSEKYIEDGSVFQLKEKEPLPPRSIGYCYSKKLQLSPAAKKFIVMI